MERTSRIPRGARALGRAAVKAQLSVIALDVVTARGYDDTTVEDVCAAAQISRATFFRYFPTKEDAVLGDTISAGDLLVEALLTRPANESPWLSLRRAFDPLLERYTGTEARRLAQLVVTTPTLAARHHEKNATVAERLRPEVARRLGVDPENDLDPVPAALIAATLACVEAALAAWIADDQPRTLAQLLDSAMSAVAGES